MKTMAMPLLFNLLQHRNFVLLFLVVSCALPIENLDSGKGKEDMGLWAKRTGTREFVETYYNLQEGLHKRVLRFNFVNHRIELIDKSYTSFTDRLQLLWPYKDSSTNARR